MGPGYLQQVRNPLLDAVNDWAVTTAILLAPGGFTAPVRRSQHAGGGPIFINSNATKLGRRLEVLATNLNQRLYLSSVQEVLNVDHPWVLAEDLRHPSIPACGKLMDHPGERRPQSATHNLLGTGTADSLASRLLGPRAL
eukprot:CAMPEP_0204500144 /NCGR_PEP_ID=MMETSP0471-20130131/96585_1 /ASSEMBLY_ACC=CAM_ASM_000602 /TAXON_ID=2969 /ORGANISM="Oxyrrhis marina" /LENGTH=139 /DNA_ID=CAMNT_0051504741 /DNA_START=147 /DNA_END=566 /DNA_ORIENTATION=+